MLPNVGLHTHSVKRVLPQESKPCLDSFRVSIFDLHQTAESNSLEVLLALLVYEIASRDGPAFGDTWKGHRTGDGEVKVVGGADREVGKEFHVLDAVRPQLEIADWKAIFRLPSEGSHINRLHASW